MIPDFPDFVALSLQHASEIVRLTRGLPEYSDYNPVSMLAWDIDNNTLISKIDDALVVIFKDYINASHFISVHGKSCTEEAIGRVLSFAEQHGLEPSLRLIAREVAKKLSSSAGLKICPDRNNYDYLIQLDAIAALSGKEHRRFRQQLNVFKNRYESISSISLLNLHNKSDIKEILEVFHTRELQKPSNDARNELAALNRCLQLGRYFHIVAFGIRIGGKLEGFIIFEQSKTHIVEHFKKANIVYTGIYQYLFHNCCKFWREKGFEVMNIEQDLGISGLRIAKKSLRPTYLRKYSISRSTPQPSAPISGHLH